MIKLPRKPLVRTRRERRAARELSQRRQWIAVWSLGVMMLAACVACTWGNVQDGTTPAPSVTSGMGSGVQQPRYSGPAACLTEGVPLPLSCHTGLPECLEEDGSGPGVWCFWTDPDGTGIWFNDGDESNDPVG